MVGERLAALFAEYERNKLVTRLKVGRERKRAQTKQTHGQKNK